MFADEQAFSMQTVGNHGNLLATKAERQKVFGAATICNQFHLVPANNIQQPLTKYIFPQWSSPGCCQPDLKPVAKAYDLQYLLITPSCYPIMVTYGNKNARNNGFHLVFPLGSYLEMLGMYLGSYFKLQIVIDTDGKFLNMWT